MKQIRNIFLLTLSLVFLYGCVGSPIHSTLTYSSIQSSIKDNNSALLKLQTGLSQEAVLKIMGEPERCEGYQWGTAWFYRTAMTNGPCGGIYGTVDADFTPVMFDQNKILLGWGRNYYEQHINKHEITINH